MGFWNPNLSDFQRHCSHDFECPKTAEEVQKKSETLVRVDNAVHHASRGRKVVPFVTHSISKVVIFLEKRG